MYVTASNEVKDLSSRAFRFTYDGYLVIYGSDLKNAHIVIAQKNKEFEIIGIGAMNEINKIKNSHCAIKYNSTYTSQGIASQAINSPFSKGRDSLVSDVNLSARFEA